MQATTIAPVQTNSAHDDVPWVPTTPQAIRALRIIRSMPILGGSSSTQIQNTSTRLDRRRTDCGVLDIWIDDGTSGNLDSEIRNQRFQAACDIVETLLPPKSSVTRNVASSKPGGKTDKRKNGRARKRNPPNTAEHKRNDEMRKLQKVRSRIANVLKKLSSVSTDREQENDEDAHRGTIGSKLRTLFKRKSRAQDAEQEASLKSKVGENRNGVEQEMSSSLPPEGRKRIHRFGDKVKRLVSKLIH